MNSFQELRYPFTSLVEFVGGGYWINRAGWHLTLGALFFAALVLWVWTRPGSPLERLIVVYFSTAIFNNPAYSLAGLRFGELAGVAAAVGVGAALFGGRPVDLRRVGAPLCLAALVLAAHAALVGALYPRIDPDAPTQVLRAVVVSRVMVLGLVILGIEQTFTRAAQFDRLVRAMVLGGCAGAVVYIAQTAVFLTGTLPYGTYWDAGFTGVPSFGSVSIERGHFGKFLAPLFPFYVLLLIRSRWRAAFALFLGVSLVNFSASSIAFIAGYAAITAALLRRDLLRPAVAAAGVVLLGAVAALGVVFGEQYGAVFQKIVDVGVRGEEVGGRGLPVLEAYLARFPLGTGYGGSTLRVVGELPEINMGGFALISQLSAVALPIVLGFVWLNWRVLRASRGTTDARTRALLVCGVIMSGLIGVVDILWFVPTIWAPLVIADGLAFAARGGVPAPAGVAAAGRPAADPPFRTLPHPPR